MNRINAYKFYSLGQAIQPLLDFKKETPAGVMTFVDVKIAHDALEEILRNELVPLRNSIQPAKDLIAALKAAWPNEHGFDESRTLGDHGWLISDAAKRFETVYATDLAEIGTYVVAQKRIFSTDSLLARAEEILPASVLEQLPPLFTTDIREAGKCLAFECATASAFHTFRAVETAMKALIDKLGGQQPPDGNSNWGALIRALVDARADQRVTNALRQMKDLHRNPVMHPEAVLSLDEAISALMIAQSVVLAMFPSAVAHAPS